MTLSFVFWKYTKSNSNYHYIVAILGLPAADPTIPNFAQKFAGKAEIP